METYYRAGSYSINFKVQPKLGNKTIDELAFIYLVRMKCSGQIQSVHPFWDVVNQKKMKFLSIEIVFPDWEKFDGAQSHCERNLNKDGEILPDYLAALDSADPGRVKAKALLERALAAPSSN